MVPAVRTNNDSGSHSGLDNKNHYRLMLTLLVALPNIPAACGIFARVKTFGWTLPAERTEIVEWTIAALLMRQGLTASSRRPSFTKPQTRMLLRAGPLAG